MGIYLKLFLVLILIVFVIAASRFFFLKKPISQQNINFSSLKLPHKKNYCLVYGKKSGERLRSAPISQGSPQALLAIWQQLVSQTPRMQLLQAKDFHYSYVVRSRVFAFPDLVDIEIAKQGDDGSQLFIYSRSIYGYYDFGANCNRVDQWLSDLKNHSK